VSVVSPSREPARSWWHRAPRLIWWGDTGRAAHPMDTVLHLFPLPQARLCQEPKYVKHRASAWTSAPPAAAGISEVLGEGLGGEHSLGLPSSVLHCMKYLFWLAHALAICLLVTHQAVSGLPQPTRDSLAAAPRPTAAHSHTAIQPRQNGTGAALVQRVQNRSHRERRSIRRASLGAVCILHPPRPHWSIAAEG
jgi:hypothetical protein